MIQEECHEGAAHWIPHPGVLLGSRQRRFEILRFFDAHGLAPTTDAFHVSRRTLYRWQVLARPPEVLACSTRKRIRDGMCRSIVTFIDPVSHFAFAVGLPSKHARHTARALDWGLSLLPQTPKILLSDNGSEFEADFARLLTERAIGRWDTSPKCRR
ncbi:MAG: hypothetical protein HXY19_04605 [Thermoanaerobaculaceae bacterium]|nr:hypothetical protein [Thermoanaerobaculaceae bacterium]